MATAQTLISSDVALFFERTNLLGPSINKKRKISCLALPSSSCSSRSSSSSTRSVSSASFPATFTNVPQDEIEVPESLKSAETYEFISFDRETALEIWSRFIDTSDPDDPEGDFMDYARSYVNHSGVSDALSVLDDWTSTMNRLGINKTLQSAIMLSEFDDLRSTASCKFWVLDSMAVAYATLEHLNHQLRSEMARRQRITKTGHRDKSVSVPEAPARLDGHTMIWRGCSRLSALEFCEGHPDHLVLRGIVACGQAPEISVTRLLDISRRNVKLQTGTRLGSSTRFLQPKRSHIDGRRLLDSMTPEIPARTRMTG